MTSTQVTGVFVMLLLLLIGTGYVSSQPVQGEQMALVQSDESYLSEAHFARYQEHLVSLGIDRFICQ